MKRWLHSLCILTTLALSSCAGYHINGNKPGHMTDVTKLYVPTFENNTLEPRLAVEMTNAVIKQLQASGTYQVVSKDDADATLKGVIFTIDRSQWRSVRSNTLRTKELLARMKMNYTVQGNSGEVLTKGRIQGVSYVPIDPNWQTSERQLFSEICERMAVTLSDEISNGW